jgi:dCTP deaminase
MVLSGRDLQLYVETKRLVLSPIEQSQFQQNGIDFILDDIKPQNGPFYLGCTKEYIVLPDDLMGFVEIRSTWARKGYFLPPTIIDAGFKGVLTLEILHFGTGHPIETIGKRFAHIIFAKLSGPSVPYNGKYQGQVGITRAIED